MIKVGITGGIGSGKSTVCRLFAACGAPVYDSDTQAKRLMEEDGPLRRRLAARFGEEIYAGGRLNRKLLAGRVFSDPAELSALNALVHPAVMEDFERWCGRQSGADYVVLESAILFEGLYYMDADSFVFQQQVTDTQYQYILIHFCGQIW